MPCGWKKGLQGQKLDLKMWASSNVHQDIPQSRGLAKIFQTVPLAMQALAINSLLWHQLAVKALAINSLLWHQLAVNSLSLSAQVQNTLGIPPADTGCSVQ